MEPKAGENDAAQATPAAETGKSRKSRPVIDIDLPAEAVKEEPREPAKANIPNPSLETPDPEAPPRAKSPKALPALLGLVAGAVGGFGAWHITGLMDGGVGKLTAGLDQRLVRLEQARPATPADLVDRLTRAERGLAEVTPREQALRAEIEKLQAAIGAEQAERTKALAALGQRVAAPTVAPVPVTAPASSETPSSRLDEMQARLEGLTPKLDSVTEQVANLSKSLTNVAGRDDLSRASAMLVTTGLLGEAFQRHEALGGILETLRAMGIGEAELSALMPFATSAPPSPATLLAEIRAIAAKNTGEKTEGDFFERMRSGAANLVDIRRTGEITGTDDAAHVARAEQALQRGDVSTALTLMGRLTPSRAEGFAGWRTKAEQRVKATEAISKLRSESLARLSRAALAAK
ncbi:MAG: COG4223 family protein [Rhabdaerophilum sp.]